ncbi:hypothetical protein [Deinococcus sp.]|uniref:hypothetical protein n=1 Tax=Deinococcus sp. TaxID=47478 RepID=UPI003C7B34DA
MTVLPGSSLSRAPMRLPLLAALGVTFWFLAAMTIRFLGPGVFVPGGSLLPLVFLLTLPVAWAFVWLGLLLSGARGAAVFPAATLMTSVAMLCDGVALTFFPALYGLTSVPLLLGAAWILWGAGLIQLMAYWWPHSTG